MNGGGAAGNPSAASSHSLPVHVNKEMLQPAGEDQQSSELDRAPGSQEHQSPGDQRTGQTQQTREEPDQLDITKQANHHEPPTENQRAGDSPAPRPGLPARTKLSPPLREQDVNDPLLGDQPPPTEPDPLCKKREQTSDQSQEQQTQRRHDPGPRPTDDLTLTSSSKSKDQQNHQDPPPPDPPQVDSQQTPPPSGDHQNHHDPPQVSSLTQHLTEASTLAPPPTIEAFCDQVPPSPQEPKLCGFLQKQAGPLRAWKQRWFTYEEKKNQLFYYRTPQDVMPLGHVELSSATFTYPLKAESGTFHIKTPERTFILKAVTQELMLYWLLQLQAKRWQHRQTSTCPDNNTDDFLPVLKSPLGLVGEEAANIPMQRMPLANMSLKHPLIELQNSVHSLWKRSSQEWSQSPFRAEAPPWTHLSTTDTSNTCTHSTHCTTITTLLQLITLLIPTLELLVLVDTTCRVFHTFT
ncbi:hypothetical protein INR49_009501 [Caranx melampygus]|nr:hypothetical protein INR49_009501 [Caranx melampygus]